MKRVIRMRRPSTWFAAFLVAGLFFSSPAFCQSRVSVYLMLKTPSVSPVWFQMKGLSISQEGGGWEELGERSREIDSSKIGGGQVFLGVFQVPQGTYTRLKLTLEKAALMRGGEKVFLSLARKEVEFHISPPLNLREGDSTCLFLYWDVEASVKGGFSFDPVIQVKPQAIPITSELLYVTCDDMDTLYVIRADKNWVVGSLGLGKTPRGLGLDRSSNRLYVVEAGSRDIKVVELSTTRVVDSIMLPFVLEPMFLALSPDGTRAYVTDNKANYLLKVNMVSGTVEDQAELGHGLYFPLYVQGGGILAVSSPRSQKVYLVDPGGLKVRQEVRAGDGPEGLLAQGGFLYVANRRSNTVTVYDLREGRMVGQINVGLQPRRLVECNGKVYVANYGDGTLSLLLPGRLVVMRRVRVGGTPFAMAYSPARRWLYVLDRRGRKVRVVDLTSERLVTTVSLGGRPFDARFLQ